MTFSIDRIEGNVAICEMSEMIHRIIETEKLPAGAKEGDVISADENGNLFIDEKKTSETKNRLLYLQNSLFDE